jgi:hypothetical protein
MHLDSASHSMVSLWGGGGGVKGERESDNIELTVSIIFITYKNYLKNSYSGLNNNLGIFNHSM